MRCDKERGRGGGDSAVGLGDPVRRGHLLLVFLPRKKPGSWRSVGKWGAG